MAKESKKSFPSKLDPMLCTLVKEIQDDSDFLYEVKWDGYRIISYVKDGDARLASRGGLDYTKKYPLVAKALKDLEREVVLDGEVVVFNNAGVPDFDALQLYNGHTTSISYCIFDILWLDGHNIMNLPLVQRKQILQVLLADDKILQYSQSFENGSDLYQEMLDNGWEGIVAKRKESPYVPGERGSNWLKVPTVKRQEFVIGGWAESDKSRLFRSLLFGAYNEKGEFEWIGRSGGGYKEKDMPEIMSKLKPLEVKKSPFVNPILDTKGAVIHYVKPELVANFAFATWTKSGRIRKPATFLGFREDKNPIEVVREVPKENVLNSELAVPTNANQLQQKKDVTSKGVYLNDDSGWKDLDALEVDDEREMPVGDERITVNNLGKLLWKDADIKKVDLMSYYASMSELILPYLKDRPLSLYLKHTAPTAPGLYVKDMEGRTPSFADSFTTPRKHKKKGKRDIIEYLVCNNEATLLYIINLGAIDINPWSSKVQSAINPDYITIDLDPSDGDFSKAIETALAAKDFFDQHKITSFPKTSGKTGIHLLLPCHRFTFEQGRAIGTFICDEIQKLVPHITTRERRVDARGNLLYVDDSQNDFADTIASVYSVRPYHIPTISTPLHWSEVNSKLNPESFTINTIKKRIQKEGDLFKGIFDKTMIASAQKQLENLS
jgi:bifunctional non-homologous end joining protein LigD